MSGAANGCLACAIVAGERRPPGGILWRGEGLVLHGFADPSPILGWVVLTTERHARALYELDEAEAGAVGRIAARVMRLQREVLGAEHAYAFAIGDLLQHFHLHLVPRFADTPEHLRGRKCFEGRPEEMKSRVELEAAARALGEALRQLLPPAVL